MDSNLENFQPKPTTWLETEIEYVGVGCAVFEDPAGIIKGFAKATFSENGDYSIEMEAEEVETSNSLPNQWDAIIHILTGQTPVKVEEGYFWGGPFPAKENQCTSLTITTTEGVFSAIGKINYHHHLLHKLEFFLIQSRFEIVSPYQEYYWVLPLSNLVSNFTQSDKLLDQHPLRIYPTPIISEKFSQQESDLIYLYANSKNSLIIFEYSRNLAFIEALHDYKERKRKLEEGKEKILITAIMVGEVDTSAPDEDRSAKPSNFLPLLGLASGSPVGAPWIEFRDKQGKLIRRIHQKLNCESYRKGHITLHDYVENPKIGNFLTQAQSSQNLAKGYVLISASLAIEGGFFSFHITAALGNLFSAFDILCKEYDLREEYLLQGVDQVYQDQIRQILKKARTEIQQIASSITDVNLYSQKRNIEKVAERVFLAWGKANDSGLATATLHQTSLVFMIRISTDCYYASDPRPDGLRLA